jgi:hypothetical protein
MVFCEWAPTLQSFGDAFGLKELAMEPGEGYKDSMASEERPMRYCMPPDPNPKLPQFTPPPNSCDTHFHVFGPPDKFPFAEKRAYTPPAAPVEHYFQMTAVLGIQRGVVVQPSLHGFDNTATLDAIARSNGRFMGTAWWRTLLNSAGPWTCISIQRIC